MNFALWLLLTTTIILPSAIKMPAQIPGKAPSRIEIANQSIRLFPYTELSLKYNSKTSSLNAKVTYKFSQKNKRLIQTVYLDIHNLVSTSNFSLSGMRLRYIPTEYKHQLCTSPYVGYSIWF